MQNTNTNHVMSIWMAVPPSCFLWTEIINSAKHQCRSLQTSASATDVCMSSLRRRESSCLLSLINAVIFLLSISAPVRGTSGRFWASPLQTAEPWAIQARFLSLQHSLPHPSIRSHPRINKGTRRPDGGPGTEEQGARWSKETVTIWGARQSGENSTKICCQSMREGSIVFFSPSHSSSVQVKVRVKVKGNGTLGVPMVCGRDAHGWNEVSLSLDGDY